MWMVRVEFHWMKLPLLAKFLNFSFLNLDLNKTQKCLLTHPSLCFRFASSCSSALKPHRGTHRHLSGFHTEWNAGCFSSFPTVRCVTKSFFPLKEWESKDWGRAPMATVYACIHDKKNAKTTMFISMKQQGISASQASSVGSLQENLSHISHSSPPGTSRHSSPRNSWLIMQCVPFSVPEPRWVTLPICCCGIWEDFKHGKKTHGDKVKEKEAARGKKALRERTRGGARDAGTDGD